MYWCAGPERDTALDEFYQKWQDDNLVSLKWLTLKAASNVPNNVETVKQLMDHKAFNIKNPNSCYSLFIGFCQSHPNFHAEDGSGYKFMADSILKVIHSAVFPSCKLGLRAALEILWFMGVSSTRR